MGVLNDLKERGVEDILIACVDGLKSFLTAINSVFPNAEVQLCVVHQIRNSLKYVSSKDVKIFMSDLKKVYQASSREIAENYSPFYNTPNEIRHVFMAIYRPVAYYDLFGLL